MKFFDSNADGMVSKDELKEMLIHIEKERIVQKNFYDSISP